MSLNDKEKINYIKQNFHQYFDIGLNLDIETSDFVNLVIPKASIIDELTIVSPYLNSDLTNVVFTPKEDYNTIYRFEIYKDVFYIKMEPYSQDIRMHILPKAYDCSNNLLIFKDEMIDKTNVNKTNDYHYYEEREPINSYYYINDIDRDRDNPDISSVPYKIEDWSNTFCDFSYNISKKTKTFTNLQICAGYRYNQSTPYYSVHYTGVRDKTNIPAEDKCTLIDANYDEVVKEEIEETNEISNNYITQYHYDSNKFLYIPKGERDIKGVYNGKVDHLSQIGKLHRKTLKYFNDSLYSEEDKKYAIADWEDISRG